MKKKKRELLKEIESLKNSVDQLKDSVQFERKRTVELRDKILDEKISLVNSILKGLGETNHEIRFDSASTEMGFSCYQTHIFTLTFR
jgi:predicted  nucleic acid-binding Zn-ribbon protein